MWRSVVSCKRSLLRVVYLFVAINSIIFGMVQAMSRSASVAKEQELRTSSDALCSSKELKLHFDINNTIVAIDTAWGKDLNTTIDDIMAKSTFAQWDTKKNQSYYDYVADQIERENVGLSRTGSMFSDKVFGRIKDFSQYLQQYPELLKKYDQEKTKMFEILSGTGPIIFPSFYKIIRWLDSQYPGRYTIYLRTFGKDLPQVVSAIEKNTSLKFIAQGTFHDTTLSMTVPSSSLFGFLAGVGSKHYAIHDDYAYWKTHGYQVEGAKPFPIDLQNSHVVSMFFDDFASDPYEPTVHPMGPDGKSESLELLLQRGNVVAVNSKEAILNEDYFINKIKEVIEKS